VVRPLFSEPHRAGINLSSTGDGWEPRPTQKVTQGGRGGLPDGGSDPGPKTGRSRAVSGPRRVTLGVPPPPLIPP